MQTVTIILPLFSVTISAEHETEIIPKLAFWLSLPTKCPKCSKVLILNYRKPKTFQYYELKCIGTPSHSVNLGESQGSHNLYFDNKKPWTTYEPNAIESEPTTTQPTTSPAGSGGNKNFGEVKNRLIKLIGECKAAGIRSGLVPGDVGGMDETATNDGIQRLTKLLQQERQ